MQTGKLHQADDRGTAAETDRLMPRCGVRWSMAGATFSPYLIGRLGNSDDAQEVLQRFVLRAPERSNDLRDVRAVRGWLARVLSP